MFGLVRYPAQATDSSRSRARGGCRPAARDGRACTATRPPDLTTPNGPAFTKRAIPTARSIEAALAWRYPTNIPAAPRSQRPATPGEASAASASKDSGARTASTVCWRTDRTLLRKDPVRQHRLESNRVLFSHTGGAEARRSRMYECTGRCQCARIARSDEHPGPARLHCLGCSQLRTRGRVHRACQKASADSTGGQRGGRPIAHQGEAEQRQKITREY